MRDSILLVGLFVATFADARAQDAKIDQAEPVMQIGHTGRVEAVAFGPSGRLLATASNDFTAILWDVKTGKKLRTYAGHRGEVTSLALSEDEKLLATASADSTVIVWETGSGKKLQQFAGVTSYSFKSVALSGDGKWLAAAPCDTFGNAAVWNTVSGKRIHILRKRENTATPRDWVRSLGTTVNSVALSRDGKYAATGLIDNTSVIWETETGKELHTLEGHSDCVASVCFSGDGKLLREEVSCSWAVGEDVPSRCHAVNRPVQECCHRAPCL